MDLTFRGADPAPTETETGTDAVARIDLARPVRAVVSRTSRGWQIAAVVTLALGVFVRFAAWSHLWLDEALTVNIARLPISQIPAALRQDGAPPLYYVLLHGWMSLFGTGTFAVRALPGIFGVIAMPLMWLAAGRVAGRRVAWAATLLLAAGPFAARYATEGRMYSLEMVLVLVAFLAVMRLLDGGGWRPAVVVGLTTAALLLTHYWSFYLLAATGIALLVLARRSPDPARTGARRALLAIAVGCLAFIPWAPSFLYQLHHTGTPWGSPGDLRSLFDTVTEFAGGYWDPGIVLGLLYFGLIALAAFGVSLGGGRLLLELRRRGPGRWLAALTFGTLAIAIVAGLVGRSAFAIRYAAILYPLFVVLLAVGLGVLTDGRVFHVVLAVAVVLGFWADIPNVVGDRTSAGHVASVIDANAKPGDVVGYCPDQLGPSVSRVLDAQGVVQLTFPRAASPERVDWRDYAAVNHAARPADFANLLNDRAGADHDVWLVWAPGYQTFGSKCSDIIDDLARLRPDYSRVVKVSTAYFERPGLVRFRAG